MARDLVRELLESVTGLRDLTLILDWREYWFDCGPDPAAVAKILFAGHFSRLETLHLKNLTIVEADLIATLTRCQSTLFTVTLNHVRITGSNSAWLKAFSVLASMPSLSNVRLNFLNLNDSDPQCVVFTPLVEGESVQNNSMVCEGREQVIAGLKELSAETVKVVNDCPPKWDGERLTSCHFRRVEASSSGSHQQASNETPA